MCQRTTYQQTLSTILRIKLARLVLCISQEYFHIFCSCLSKSFLLQPILRILEPILKNASRELLHGSHTRSISISTPSNSGIMKFAKKQLTCIGCKALLRYLICVFNISCLQARNIYCLIFYIQIFVKWLVVVATKNYLLHKLTISLAGLHFSEIFK